MTDRLYTAYHKTAPLLDAKIVVPMHVGRAGAAAPLPGMVGDDTGTHISDRNGAYCELTALYWAWKNDHDATRIGLMHYRRVLDIADQHQGDTAELFLSRFDIPDWATAATGWLADNADVDMIVPKPHVMGTDLITNYARRSQPQDLDATRAIIAADHADWLADYDRVMAGNALRLGNMMLMRRDLLDRYCTWAFDILDKVAARDLNRSLYNPYQSRYLGFIAERLLTVFVDRMQREDASLTIREVHILNLSEALVTPYIADDSLNGPDQINAAFAADRAYLPHTAAMLRSMLDHAAPDRQLNLFFLYTDVDPVDRALLAEVTATRPRTALHFINAGNPFATSYRSASRAPSNATYNRFLLFDLLPGLDRLMYVDVDMIFRGDIATIWDTDMAGAPLGAVTDYIMTRTLTGPTPTVQPGIPDMGTYQREVLGMSDAQIAGYFNAGLLLFDFTAMEDVGQVGRDLMQMAQTGKYMFRDQDILNSYFKDRVFHLPPAFNAFNTRPDGYDRVPGPNHAAAMAGRADPLIIHYAAGDHKPWNGHAISQAQHYWAALAQTPFYPEVLASNAAHAKRAAGPLSRERLVATGKQVATKVPALRGPMLRAYGALRKVTGR